MSADLERYQKMVALLTKRLKPEEIVELHSLIVSDVHRKWFAASLERQAITQRVKVKK